MPVACMRHAAAECILHLLNGLVGGGVGGSIGVEAGGATACDEGWV